MNVTVTEKTLLVSQQLHKHWTSFQSTKTGKILLLFLHLTKSADNDPDISEQPSVQQHPKKEGD